MSEQPAEEPTVWSVVADPDEERIAGMPAFLRGTMFGGTGPTVGWLLRNEGPHAARRVELLPEDPEQPVDGPLRWESVPAGGSVPFRAGRRLLRLRWFQRREDSRYWRLVALPSS
ncbi:hypothetical protein [Arenivirga flava]|uniref:Uncharacterized protein n=1 Tax=Arenivirga flava TaxID=1930060 RepID=A0AA37XCD4_9MICO|nr:hypothetical protein [Arenivirga flava]GMA29700.1 hypothetical protein GCM10025874_29530 [Arenivirga flava]